MPDSLPETTLSDPRLPDILQRICADTRAETARRQEATPLPMLKSKIHHNRDRPRGFSEALKARLLAHECGLIAEFKRRSPSGGDIRPGADPAEVARAYQAGGAACLSVLTDSPHFGGTAADLKAARDAVTLPVLRKDFILETWQVYESRAMGADCILLIMAALTDAAARDLEQTARALDMDVLVEVHDRHELDRALGLQTPLLGVNNRNLKTLETKIETTLQLAEFVPPDRMLVTESGLRCHADVTRLAAVGAHCLLVGESLLREPDIAQATRQLLGTCP